MTITSKKHIPKNSSDPQTLQAAVSLYTARHKRWGSIGIGSQTKLGVTCWAEPEELGPKCLSGTTLPQIDGPLPQIAKLLITRWIKAVSDHWIPTLYNSAATPVLSLMPVSGVASPGARLHFNR
jgi:hypothetical protein